MTRAQHEATRMLEHAQAEWLRTYGWVQVGRSWCHPNAPQICPSYSLWDAFIMTRGNTLRFGSVASAGVAR